MLLAEAALQRKHCTAACCKTIAGFHRHSQGALVLHVEPQFAVKTDASWCTPGKNKSGAYYCTAGLSKAGQMLLIVMHVYMCMRIALAPQHVWCHFLAVPASCKHVKPNRCL